MKNERAIIRRFVDADGNECTYMPLAAISATIGVVPETIMRWAETGAIRALAPMRGKRYYCVSDAARIRSMDVRESLALGIYRRPEDQRRAEIARKNAYQDETMPGATKHRDRWTDDDEVSLVEMFLAETPIREMATKLGRTYQAVTDRLNMLRDSGVLDEIIVRDSEWWTRAQAVLTAAERERIEQKSSRLTA